MKGLSAGGNCSDTGETPNLRDGKTAKGESSRLIHLRELDARVISL